MKKTDLTTIRQTFEPVGNRLWFYRQKRGYSQKIVASLLGHKSPARVSNYERGNRLPRLTTALKLSIILQTPIAQLYPSQYAQLSQDIIQREKRLVASHS